MSRVARIVMPDCPHHVTQRGNNRQDVFFVPDDYAAYLRILKEQARRYGLDVHAYCLMTNHVHLVATPHGADSLAKAVGRTDWLYTRYVNRLHGRSGHLWQNRFYSCALDSEHFWRAIAYVERNPVRARLHRNAWLYAWSSAAAHCGGVTDDTGLLDLAAWRRTMSPKEWQAELTRQEDEEALAAFRSQTHRGRPLGTDSFMSKVEQLLGRRVRPLRVGRPAKRTKMPRKARRKR